ncbi:hypothetical protein QL285_021307 [Trifolium repens]|nr:hypothetical protein QL285_021307 [Trifolium repens]
MHSDLHSAGYFLNPQFQYGFEHGDDVYKETFEGTTRVIMKLERSIDDQIKALNQLTLYREKMETFRTPLAQRSWSKMTADTDDEIVEVDDDNNKSNDSGDGGGLSPPSGNGGDGGGNEESNEGDGGGGDDEEDAPVDQDPYGETPPIYRRYRNLIDMDRSDGSLLNSGGDVSHSRRGKRKQNVPLEDSSSSSSIAQSFSDFAIGDSSQISQQSYPPIYQYPYFNSYNQYPSDQAPSNFQQSMNYEDPYYHQSSGGYFAYVFGQ